MNIIKSLLAMSMAISVCIAQDINISGIVTDTGGSPIAGAAVRLEKGGLPTTTGADGRFTITGTIGIIDQINQYLPHIYNIRIVNGLLWINILEKSAVEIITYSLQGKVISSIKKVMDIGTHSITLPRVGAGIYFYKVKMNGSEFLLKDVSIGGASGKSLSAYDPSYTTISKRVRTYIPINDVIAVTKAGFLNYRVIVTNSDTSGIEIKMIVCADTLIDVDGNVYQAVQIGNQVWMAENLRTTKYNDGSAIPLVTDAAAWAALYTDAYCYYNNTTNGDSIKKYGALYNWRAARLSKLAPAGWHTPTYEEWTVLEEYLIANGYNWDGTTTGNKIAKSLAAQTDWETGTDSGAIGNDLTKNNQSGFSALPGGRRTDRGSFTMVGEYGHWWTDEFSMDDAYLSILCCRSDDQWKHYLLKENGLSVRLLKD